MMKADKVIKRLRIKPGQKVRLKDFDPAWIPTDEMAALKDESVKDRAREILEENRKRLSHAQEVLWASDTYSVLVVLQAMDAAGKDGTIRHVMSGVNPQGCRVQSFKEPSSEELDHTFLWRAMKATPERGQIMIFNRSHYEDVLVVRVHPELLESGRVPTKLRGKKLWSERFEDINAMERHLARNGTLILKFFLNVSKDEQRKRFLDRIDDPSKHWKFSLGDVRERGLWPRYMKAYEEALTHTSTEWAPWHVIPADNKWVTRALVSMVMAEAIEGLGVTYPAVSEAQVRELKKAREGLGG